MTAAQRANKANATRAVQAEGERLNAIKAANPGMTIKQAVGFKMPSQTISPMWWVAGAGVVVAIIMMKRRNRKKS